MKSLLDSADRLFALITRDFFVRKQGKAGKMKGIKYAHTNLNARDWKKLSSFYQEVFGCRSLGKFRDNRGEWFGELTGIPGAACVGEHIALPGYPDGGPTLEIFTYEPKSLTGPLPFNGFGFAHICFDVEDVEEVYDRFIRAGGSLVGKVVRYYPERDGSNILIYGKDPEGNGIEIRKWVPGKDLTKEEDGPQIVDKHTYK